MSDAVKNWDAKGCYPAYVNTQIGLYARILKDSLIVNMLAYRKIWLKTNYLQLSNNVER